MENYEIRVFPKLADDGSTYWTACYPSVPGCVGGGDTLEEAISDAQENLNVYLEYLQEQKSEQKSKREVRKMTYEEATERIECILKNNSFTKADKNALKLAIEALEKQIPKKPLHMHKNYYCPICKEDGWMLWDDAIPNDMDAYCGKCGHAIDWED